MKWKMSIAALIISVMTTAPVDALPTPRPQPAHLEWQHQHNTRLAKFKKEQKRIVPDTKRRSTLRKINQRREDKKKRTHYKKSKNRAQDKRRAASDRPEDPRFRRKGLSDEKIEYYLDRYKERRRLREQYDRLPHAADNTIE